MRFKLLRDLTLPRAPKPDNHIRACRGEISAKGASQLAEGAADETRPHDFELPGGKPRSASDVRVGAAFATFLAWAYGDSGSVRIEIPRPFEVSASGAEVTQAVTDDATVLTATAPDAVSWYAWVNARNDGDLTRERLDIDGGEEIVVRGWPEDARWRTSAARGGTTRTRSSRRRGATRASCRTWS